MASFSPIESKSVSGALSAWNLSVRNVRQSRQLLAKSTDASEPPKTLPKGGEALTSLPPPGLAPPAWPGLKAAPGLSLPEGFTPPPGLAPPAGLVPSSGLAAPKMKGQKKIWGRKKYGSGSDGHGESDSDRTSVGTGPISLSGSSDDEDTETVAKEFKMNAHATCFVPSLLSDAPPSKTTCRQQKTPLRTPLRAGAVFVSMFAAHEAAGMALPLRPITGSVKMSAQYRMGELVSLRAEKHTPTITGLSKITSAAAEHLPSCA